MTREEVINIIDKTIEECSECEGGEGWICIDGEDYITDAGYALEGMKIYAKILKKRLADMRGDTEDFNFNFCPNCGACIKDGRTLDEFIEDMRGDTDG